MKQFLCACFALLSVSSCYSLPYSPYNKIVLSSHTCDEGEEKLAEKHVPKDERWKVDALLAQCYADSAWLALSAIPRDNVFNNNYSSIEHDCEEAKEHFCSIPEEFKKEPEMISLKKGIDFTCNHLLEKFKYDLFDKNDFYL